MKLKAPTSTKRRLFPFICCLFLFFQLSVNIYEYFFLQTNMKIPQNKISPILLHLNYNRLIENSKRIGTRFALSTIMVSLISISIFFWIHYGSFKRIFRRLQNNSNVKYLNYAFEILISVVLRTTCDLNMSPIKIFRFSAIYSLFLNSIFYCCIQRLIFHLAPEVEPVLCFIYELYNLFASNRILRNLPLENEYKSITKDVYRIIEQNNINVRIFYGTNRFGFLTFNNGNENIIVLGPLNGIFDRNELKGVILHEIYHIIDRTVLKKQILKIILLIIYTVMKLFMILRLRLQDTNSKFLKYSIFSFVLFTTVFYSSSITEHFFLQIKETQSDEFSKNNGGGEYLAKWLLKYSMLRTIPLRHSRIFNLTYYSHPTVEDRLKYLE